MSANPMVKCFLDVKKRSMHGGNKKITERKINLENILNTASIPIIICK
jgi:hypothetical protein